MQVQRLLSGGTETTLDGLEPSAWLIREEMREAQWRAAEWPFTDESGGFRAALVEELRFLTEWRSNPPLSCPVFDEDSDQYLSDDLG